MPGQAVQAKGIPMLDHLQVIRILSDGHTAYGLLCLDTAARETTVSSCYKNIMSLPEARPVCTLTVYPPDTTGHRPRRGG
ncbi:MAG: hypothetical protein ACLRI7_03150 [Ruthenibacterium lactatiformans]